MLLRMKVLQIGGGLGVVIPATQLFSVTAIDNTFELGVVAGLSVGAVAVASTCSWYCERLVQELRLEGGGKRLRVSTLTMVSEHEARLRERCYFQPTLPSHPCPVGQQERRRLRAVGRQADV